MAKVNITCTANESYTGRRGAVSFADGKAELDVDTSSAVERAKVTYFERRDGYKVSGPQGGWKLDEESSEDTDGEDDSPAQSDTKAVWAAYRGVDPDDFTKQQLVDGDIEESDSDDVPDGEDDS